MREIRITVLTSFSASMETFAFVPFNMSKNAPLLTDFITFSLFRIEEPTWLNFSSISFCCFLTALNNCTTPLKMKQNHTVDSPLIN